MIQKGIILCSLLIIIAQTSQIKYRPAELANYTKENEINVTKEGKDFRLIDPDGFTTEPQKETLFDKMNSVLTYNGTVVVLMVINQINENYENITDLPAFVNIFKNEYYPQTSITNYFFMLYVMEKQWVYYYTGETAKKKYSEKWCANITEEVKVKIQNNQFYEGFLFGIESLLQEQIPEPTSVWDIIKIILYVILGIIVIGIMIFCKYKCGCDCDGRDAFRLLR